MKTLRATSIAALAAAILAGPAIAGPESTALNVRNSHRLITLEQAYDMTLESDQSIRIAYFEIRKANLLPWSALARLGPQLIGKSNYGTSQSTVTNVVPAESGSSAFTNFSRTDSNSRFGGLSFSQTLFDPVVFPAYHLGKLTARANRLQYFYTVRQTLFGVAQAYYAVLKQQSVVDINKQTVDLAQQQLDLAQKRFDVGQVANVDVLRARATLEDARNTLIQAQGTLETNKDTLSNILNLGGATDFTLVEPTPMTADRPPFEAVLKTAYEHREDYTVSAIAIDQDVERRNEVIAQYGPTVSANADYGWTNTSGNNSASKQAYDATISVQLPILTGGQREIDLRTAKHQIEETRLNFQKTVKSVESDVKSAWVQEGTLSESIKALTAEVEANTQNYKDVQAQYEAGTATSLDVQSALRDLNNARTNLTNATYDYQVAIRNRQRSEAIFEPARVQRAKLP